VNQQQIKFGVTCGLVGVLLFGCSFPVDSQPRFPSQNRSLQFQAEQKPTGKGQKLPLSARVVVNRQPILLEVARTAPEQSMGLMYRTDIAKDRGMLFVFNPPRPVKFWMKNTLIPLDMIFMSNGVVKYIGTEILPCEGDPCPSYGPTGNINIDRVLELRGGRAAELRIKVGDRLKIQNIQPKG
jgi:uncharacterized protein